MQQMMIEEWRDIEGYEGLYQVSSLGRVKSLISGKMRKYSKRGKKNHEYLCCTLYKDKKRTHFAVHRLVAAAFIQNPDNLPMVNHKDENPLNNVKDNLEYCDNKYNCNYGTTQERRAMKISIPIDQYDLNGNFIRSWKSAKEVHNELGISTGQLSDVINNKPHHKSAGGYIWRKAV